MKRIISFLISIMLLILSLPITTIAQETEEIYTMEQIENIHSKYKKQENMFNVLFGDDSDIAYWNMVNKIESSKILRWLLEKSSMLIDEYPDKKDYAEILANLMAMQSGNLAQQIEAQSQFDDLHEGVDYVLDIVEIASSFVGGSGLLESISPIIDAGTEGLDVIIENTEQAKYYELIIQDYTQSHNFFNAIAKYAEDAELRSVAGSLLSANDMLLQKRLEYLGDTLETLESYETKFFLENLFFDVLKNTDLYGEDDTVKWFVDGGAKTQETLLKIDSQGKFIFNMMMLAGNVGFGTNNTFDRYQEMRVLSQVAEALSEANSKIKVSADYEEDDVIENIQTKCSYYKSLVGTHARGEYLVYQLLMKDAGLLSLFRELFDMFKAPEDTTESWYSKQVEVLTEYSDILDSIFVFTDNRQGRELNEIDSTEQEKGTNEKYVLLSIVWYDMNNGKTKSIQEFDYDDKGNLIEGEETFYSEDGNVRLWRKYEYEYDEKGNKIEKQYDEKGKLEHELKRNVMGIVVEGRYYYGERESRVESEYDSEGKVIRTIESGKDGIVNSDTKYQYNEKGQLTEAYGLDGSAVYEYDEKGNWIKGIAYDASMNIYNINEFEYDNQGNRLKQIVYENDIKWCWEYEYGYITISNDTQEEIGINEVSEHDICNAITEAATFAWNWFWDSSREVVDESDTYIEMLENDYSIYYKRVSYEGIRNVEDVLELTKHYFTEEIAETLIEQKLWYESGGVLYMSEPDGIGTSGPTYYEITVQKASSTEYTIMVYEYLGGELMEEPYEIHYKYVDGYWVFDEVLCMSMPIPIHVIQDTGKVNDNGIESDIVGTWINEYYDIENNWASSYQTSFEADGTVCQTGYRNKDIGTYEISEDGTYITANFTENYLDSPGEGWQLIEDYKYIVTYEIDEEEKCLHAKYSQEFKDLRYSNADDGRLEKRL